MDKSRTDQDTSQNKSESEKGMETQDDKTKSAEEARTGALGRNPLDAINRTGLEGFSQPLVITIRFRLTWRFDRNALIFI